MRPSDHDLRSASRHLEGLWLASRRAKSAPRPDELHICPECGSDLVYPTDWSQVDARQWSVDLRCPECEWRGSGVHSQEVVDRFDVELDEGTESLIDDLVSLTRANMEDEAERFIGALHRDLVLPEDF